MTLQLVVFKAIANKNPTSFVNEMEMGMTGELLEALKEDPIGNFNRLYDEAKKPVYYAILLIVRSKETAEDLMQDTFVEVLEAVPKMKDGTNPVAYAVTVAKNKALDFYRRNKRHEEYVFELQQESYFSEDSFDSGLLERIREILSEEEYAVFVLKVLGDYTFKEIAVFRKKPVGTLTWMYQEARKKLQAELGR